MGFLGRVPGGPMPVCRSSASDVSSADAPLESAGRADRTSAGLRSPSFAAGSAQLPCLKPLPARPGSADHRGRRARTHGSVGVRLPANWPIKLTERGRRFATATSTTRRLPDSLPIEPRLCSLWAVVRWHESERPRCPGILRSQRTQSCQFVATPEIHRSIASTDGEIWARAFLVARRPAQDRRKLSP